MLTMMQKLKTSTKKGKNPSLQAYGPLPGYESAIAIVVALDVHKPPGS